LLAQAESRRLRSLKLTFLTNLNFLADTGKHHYSGTADFVIRLLIRSLNKPHSDEVGSAAFMMHSNQDAKLICIIAGEDRNSRFVFALASSDAQRPILFRQESFSEGVGWFVQNEIAMTRQEMIRLRSALGVEMHTVCQRTADRISNEDSEPELRIYRIPAAS
jgi:hypothetical protein